jgi:hypothetical protein
MITFIHDAPVHETHILDVDEYGRVTITIRKSDSLVSARIDVPKEESPKDRAKSNQIANWMNSTLLTYQQEDGIPFYVAMFHDSKQLSGYLNPNQK